MNWDQGTWDSGFWDQPPASDYFNPPSNPKPRNAMKRTNYYPSRLGDQDNWLDNFALKLPLYGATLGVDPADVTAAVNDALFARYVLGTWLSAVRAFSPSTTDAVEVALSGTGTAPVALPTFTAPPLPAGVTATPPGALNRLFNLIAKMKLSGAFTEAIGTDLGIIGAEDTGKDTPRFKAELEQGAACQCVRLTFYKYGHTGVYIESRRGSGDWELLGIDTDSPYLDERPLLAAGQPEVREYRMRFWDKGMANGDWTDVTKVTVSP